MFAPSNRWISAFVAATQEVMRRCECSLNSCVEAGCIGVGVARHFGYIATPVPVAVLVQAGGEATILPGPPGSRTGRSGFDGHLLLHFAGDTVVDLTAGQFHAPARGLYVPGPITLPGCTRELLTGGVAVELPGGTTVAYQEMVGNLEWRHLPAWTGSSAITIRLTVAELYRQLDTRPKKSRVSRAR
jgi:hypothetical protein